MSQAQIVITMMHPGLTGRGDGGGWGGGRWGDSSGVDNGRTCNMHATHGHKRRVRARAWAIDAWHGTNEAPGWAPTITHPRVCHSPLASSRLGVGRPGGPCPWPDCATDAAMYTNQSSTKQTAVGRVYA